MSNLAVYILLTMNNVLVQIKRILTPSCSMSSTPDPSIFSWDSFVMTKFAALSLKLLLSLSDSPLISAISSSDSFFCITICSYLCFCTAYISSITKHPIFGYLGVNVIVRAEFEMK